MFIILGYKNYQFKIISIISAVFQLLMSPTVSYQRIYVNTLK